MTASTFHVISRLTILGVFSSVKNHLHLPHNESDSNDDQHKYEQGQADYEASVGSPCKYVLVRVIVAIDETSEEAERAAEHDSVE